MRLPAFKIVLPDNLRVVLEQHAERDGLSLAEFIRRRLASSIRQSDFDPRIKAMQATVAEMAVLIEASTGCRIDQHPAAAETLRLAISGWLERAYGAAPDANFKEGDMAQGMKFLPGNNPATIAIGAEVVVGTGTAADVIRKAKRGAGPAADTVKWLMETIDEAKEEQKHDAAEKSTRRRMRRSERQ
jgi:hypothetical protein